MHEVFDVALRCERIDLGERYLCRLGTLCERLRRSSNAFTSAVVVQTHVALHENDVRTVDIQATAWRENANVEHGVLQKRHLQRRRYG